jgi:hypothetical protein
MILLVLVALALLLFGCTRLLRSEDVPDMFDSRQLISVATPPSVG